MNKTLARLSNDYLSKLALSLHATTTLGPPFPAEQYELSNLLQGDLVPPSANNRPVLGEESGFE